MAAQPIREADIAAWRRDTLGCAQCTHLNSAGASLVPTPVHEAVIGHLELERQIGGYEAAAAAAPGIGRCYDDIAELIGARSSEIAVVSSATAAFAQALSSVSFTAGDTIVTTNADYISNQLMFLSLAQRFGVQVVRAEDDPQGGVALESLRTLVRRHKPKLVSLTWIPTNSGLVQPAADVGAICAEAGVPYLLDACQAVGQLPIDVTQLQCDFLAATARKFLRGPRGIGFLYVSERMLARGAHPLLLDMRGAAWTASDAYELFDGARRFEQWELPYALLLGMGRAARYAIDAGVERTAGRAHALAESLRHDLASLAGARVLDEGTQRCAIVSLAVDGHEASALMHALRARGIHTTAQSRADAVIDLGRKVAESTLRISPHYFNTTAELELFRGALVELISSPTHEI
jgi:selenocysteine lyase/cysteine desulfurase